MNAELTLHEILGELQAIRQRLDTGAKGVMSSAEAGEWLGVSANTVNRLVADGDLAAVSVRGLRRIPLRALEEFVERNVSGGPGVCAGPSAGGPVRDGTPSGGGSPPAVAPNGARPANPHTNQGPRRTAKHSGGPMNPQGD